MGQGYVKMFRKVLDNPNATNPMWLAVWNYLLLRATHKPVTMRISGKDRVLDPGELVCSCRKIADFFEINKDTVHRILVTMENDLMIRRKKYPRKTVVTVLNWDSYQSQQPVEGTAKGTVEGTVVGTLTRRKKKEEIKEHDMAGGEKASREMEKLAPVAREVLAEFNKRAGKRFKGDANLETIRGRLREGFTKEEMIQVIDNKVKELKGTVNEPKWLTPICIFRKTNMDRNLMFALEGDRIKEINLQDEYRRVCNSDGYRAQKIREELAEIRSGKLVQHRS